jgi:uncharacterized membrane protein
VRKWIPSSPWLAGALTLATGLCALLVSSTFWLGVVVVVLGSALTVGLGLWQDKAQRQEMRNAANNAAEHADEIRILGALRQRQGGMGE